MKQNRKKKLKGMTLIECIVAMAVLAIAGAIMARIGAVTNRLMINTNHLTNKTQAEARIGGTQDRDTLNGVYCPANTTYTSNGEQNVTFTVGGYGTVNAKRYDTKAADEYCGKNCDTSMDDDVSLQFYRFD